MLSGSKYDPVIWEDVQPLENKLDNLEMLVSDLIDIIVNHLPPEAEKDLSQLWSNYENLSRP